MSKELEISIGSELEKFEKHLSQNPRVILSARFGDGKTFFLKQFKEKHKDDLFFLTIYPVNYSVATNEDIFEYIKRDILVQLSQKKYTFDKADWKAFCESIITLENAFDVLDLLAGTCSVLPIAKHILKSAKKYAEKSQTVDKYLASFKNTKGSIYENDVYTQTIQKILGYVKEKSVLIIEDLDRLDPAHLFRILNVLGAHIDQPQEKSTNKFGFSHIISVMDYTATEHIFHHFYGEKANFEGYMRKFHTDLPFEFSIAERAQFQLYSEIRNTLLLYNCVSAVVIENKMLADKFSMLSIRDVKRIYEMDVMSEFKVKTIQVPRINVELSMSLPIFKLYVYFHKIGCSADEFYRIIMDLFKSNEYEAVNLLLPLCVVDSCRTDIAIRKPGQPSLVANFTKEGNVIVDCYTENVIFTAGCNKKEYDIFHVWQTFQRTIRNIHNNYIIDSTIA